MPGERFSVRLVHEEGRHSDRVMVEVGMDGFNVLSSDGSRVLRKYPLPHISRWSMRGSSLILFTKSPVDVEDQSLTLQGDEHTIRSVLDTLTSCCMQMAELLQHSGGGGDRNAAESLSALLKKSKKTAELPTADQVEFWRSPEKAGWMHSQGEHIKTWRKRWFVLKQGFLFRFSSAELSPDTKPRGVVDLSQVTDVADGSSATGRPNSIKLSTATGSKCYITDSETSQVEWVSALEGSIAKIVKIIAGVDEEDSNPGAAVSRALAEQFKSYSGGGRSSAPATGGGSRSGKSYRSGSSSDRKEQRPGMVNILNYGEGGFGGTGGDAGGASYAPSTSAPAGPSSHGYSGDYGYVNIDYGGGLGFQMAPPETAGGQYGGRPGGDGAGTGGGFYGNVYVPAPSTAAPQQQQQYGSDILYGTGGNGPQYGQGAPSNGAAQQYQSYQASGGVPALAGVGASGGGGGYGEYGGGGGGDSGSAMQQQGGGGTLMDAVTTPAAGPPAGQQAASPWQVHYTADGRTYYFNTITQLTQWEPPTA